jgi:hypothetical protein
MADASRLLVMTQPILGAVTAAEIEHAIPASRRRGGWDLVEVAPISARLGEQAALDWAGALAAQERIFEGRLREELPRRERLAYFGFAPIPLALHLGYRVERTRTIDVYQRHHHREDWRWPPAPAATTEGSERRRARLVPVRLPERGTTDIGPIVIRVSTSHRIEAHLTEGVVPGALASVDVALEEPQEDALGTRESLGEVVKAFSDALARLNGLFPRASEVHLFMAVPTGLAFRIGTQINPTIYPPVVGYQFQARATPCYRPVVVLTGELALGAGAAPMSMLLSLEEMMELQRAVIRAGIAAERDTLLVDVDQGLVASIATAPSPGAQVLRDLDALRRAGPLRGGDGPLVRWLRVARELTWQRPEGEVFDETLRKLLDGL